MAINLINGKMLDTVLLRGGVDLSLESNLVYFDVTNGRVGINNATPSTDLDITGAIKATTATVGNVALSVGTINATAGDLILSSSAGNISANSKRIINCANPSGVLDVVNLQTLTAAVGAAAADKIVAGDSSLTVIDAGTGSFDWVLDTASVATLTSALMSVPALTAVGTVTGSDIQGTTATLGNTTFSGTTIGTTGGVIALSSPAINLNGNVAISTMGVNNILFTNASGIVDSYNPLNFDISTAIFSLTGAMNVDDLTFDAAGITANTAGLSLTTSANGNLTVTTGSGIVDLVSSSAMQLPTGTTAERPGSPVAGMTRWNETDIEFEYYDGSIWKGISATVVPTSQTFAATIETAGSFTIGYTYEIITTGTTDYTLIGAADSNPGTVFTASGIGTGTGTASSFNYALNKSATTDSVLVSVNGIVQVPTTSYTVSGALITFDETPTPVTDIISIRFLSD